jgi:hypothetical protein
MMGYVGGNTPHIWTAAEIAVFTDRGYDWWPIWTLPERALTVVDGTQAGLGMRDELARRRYPTNRPVFLDCEHSAWAANPAGARAAIAQWKALMRLKGWANAHAYVPLDAGFDWIAWWTNVRPDVLPAGVIGQQYGGSGISSAYDLSVFDPKITGESDMSDAQYAALMAKLEELRQYLIQVMGEPTHPQSDSIRNARRDITDKSAAILTAVNGVSAAVANLAAHPGTGGGPAPEYTGTVNLTPKR